MQVGTTSAYMRLARGCRAHRLSACMRLARRRLLVDTALARKWFAMGTLPVGTAFIGKRLLRSLVRTPPLRKCLKAQQESVK
ncbi:hypothetical protein BHM03_00047615 [Ensete ventricosum]|nr:hypothetical protein BHM03_00047615 [Ensete ventricosum]